MPELPEVETVRRGLIPKLEGRIIQKVEVYRYDLRVPVPADLPSRLESRRIERIWRRAKYLLMEVEGPETVLIHLGMSGRIFLDTGLKEFRRQKHDHVIFEISGGCRMVFNDVRRFGSIDLLPRGAPETDDRLRALGPEPLGNSFSPAVLLEALNKRCGPVKPALIDQRLVAGLGNIYVSEALFRAGVSPRRRGRNVSRRQADRLVDAIRSVLGEAIEAGGSSLKDFAGTDGELGYFQHRFQVYDREGLACSNTNCGGRVKRIVQAGRSTYFCGRCQN
ncbi:MAG: bifunctional DNA-formamidopyrimidine glycosylase/DNA-(apurinic or apyrimidinic site) lyase [Sphingomonadales bacterium]